jgi:hypothetical protein
MTTKTSKKTAPAPVIGIASITITRREGLISQCDKPRTFLTLASAEAVLKRGARTCPEGGAYDKHDFVIAFSDGEKYEGRIDLKRKHATTGYSITDHVVRFVEFHAGTSCPSHMTAKEYAKFLDAYVPTEQRLENAKWLKTYGPAFA